MVRIINVTIGVLVLLAFARLGSDEALADAIDVKTTSRISSPADAEWAEFDHASKMFASPEAYAAYLKLSMFETKKFEDRFARNRMRMAEDLWNRFPDDKRHLDALESFLSADPLFIDVHPPRLAKAPPKELRAFMRWLPRDSLAEIDWLQKGVRMVASVLRDPALSREDKERVEFDLFGRDLRRAMQQYLYSNHRDSTDEAYWAPFRARFDAHVIKYADLGIMGDRALDYLAAIKSVSAPVAKTGWQHVIETPGVTDDHGRLADAAGLRALRVTATTQLGQFAIEASEKPVDMKFTAIDGRAIDVAQWRGKVVLIDFWATWCQACIDELPNLTNVYHKYHDRGFEVVGISFDAESNRGKLISLLRTRELTWPQRFEGKGIGADYYWQLFGLNSLPTALLLDKRGIIVDKRARGDRLEPLVVKYVSVGPSAELHQ